MGMQEGRTDVLSRLKREKTLEIQRTRGEKRRDEWTEKKRGMCWARGREVKRGRNGSTKGREENRGLAAQTRSIRPLPPTSPPLPRRARGRTERNLIPTRTHRYTTESSRFFFSTRLSFSLFRSLYSLSSLDIFSPLALSTIRHFKRERAPILPRRVDFLTMTLARTYCLS